MGTAITDEIRAKCVDAVAEKIERDYGHIIERDYTKPFIGAFDLVYINQNDGDRYIGFVTVDAVDNMVPDDETESQRVWRENLATDFLFDHDELEPMQIVFDIATVRVSDGCNRAMMRYHRAAFSK